MCVPPLRYNSNRQGHDQQLREKDAQHNQTKEGYDEKLRHLEQGMKDMEKKAEFEYQRYLNRESRSEDLVQMEQLQTALVEAERMRQRAVVSMYVCLWIDAINSVG